MAIIEVAAMAPDAFSSEWRKHPVAARGQGHAGRPLRPIEEIGDELDKVSPVRSRGPSSTDIIRAMRDGRYGERSHTAGAPAVRLNVASVFVAEPPARWRRGPSWSSMRASSRPASFVETDGEQAEAQMRGRKLCAPALIDYEIVNVALSKVRGRGISADDSARMLALYADFDIDVPCRRFAIGESFGLAAYDAAYLWVAGHLRAPVATFDSALRRRSEIVPFATGRNGLMQRATSRSTASNSFRRERRKASTKLRAARREFAKLKPAFFSVTFGAGGSTREGTLATVLEIRGEGRHGAPHVSCIGSTRDDIREVLANYREHGIRHLVALRGDLPSGIADVGDFRYANELVRFIREETGDWFHIDVAALSRIPSAVAQSAARTCELSSARSMPAPNSAITQYFFNADAYCHFVDEARALGIDVPIVPGIMPIASFTKLARFSDACGAEIPRWIRSKLEGFGDDSASIRAFGLDVVTRMCASLSSVARPACISTR